ncbi:hypothetical protein K456DRAFT_28740 [Colletotrichum gloeosporioides 23]|nr:hypothetical protein K456DRAFT_28740 [Colletotrichum gloeosporioides 23]
MGLTISSANNVCWCDRNCGFWRCAHALLMLVVAKREMSKMETGGPEDGGFGGGSNVQQGARSGMTGVGYATDYPRSRLENEARRVGESLRSSHRTGCGRVDKPWRQTDLKEGRGWWESEREEDAQVMDDGTKGTSAVWLEGWGWDAGLGRYLPEVGKVKVDGLFSVLHRTAQHVKRTSAAGQTNVTSMAVASIYLRYLAVRQQRHGDGRDGACLGLLSSLPSLVPSPACLWVVLSLWPSCCLCSDSASYYIPWDCVGELPSHPIPSHIELSRSDFVSSKGPYVDAEGFLWLPCCKASVQWNASKCEPPGTSGPVPYLALLRVSSLDPRKASPLFPVYVLSLSLTLRILVQVLFVPRHLSQRDAPHSGSPKSTGRCPAPVSLCSPRGTLPYPADSHFDPSLSSLDVAMFDLENPGDRHKAFLRVALVVMSSLSHPRNMANVAPHRTPGTDIYLWGLAPLSTAASCGAAMALGLFIDVGNPGRPLHAVPQRQGRPGGAPRRPRHRTSTIEAAQRHTDPEVPICGVPLRHRPGHRGHCIPADVVKMHHGQTGARREERKPLEIADATSPGDYQLNQRVSVGTSGQRHSLALIASHCSRLKAKWAT